MIGGPNGTWVEMIGRIENDRVIQTRVDDLLVCLRSYGPVTFEERGTGIAAIGPEGRVFIAARDLMTGRTQEMVITSSADGFQYAWSVDGEPRAFGPDASEWRDAMLEVLGTAWQSSGLRGALEQLSVDSMGVLRRLDLTQAVLEEQLRASRERDRASQEQMARLAGRVAELRTSRAALDGVPSDTLRVRLREVREAVDSARATQLRLRTRLDTLAIDRARIGVRELTTRLDPALLEAQTERLREIIRRIP